MAGQKESTILEWVILLGLTACAIALCEVIGLTQMWEDCVVYTVVVFTVVLRALRSEWGQKEFWESLALVFTGHMVVVLVVLLELPPRRFGIPKLLLVPIGGMEFVFIAGIVKKRMALLRLQRRDHEP